MSIRIDGHRPENFATRAAKAPTESLEKGYSIITTSR
jgi:hypothetical protein